MCQSVSKKWTRAMGRGEELRGLSVGGWVGTGRPPPPPGGPATVWLAVFISDLWPCQKVSLCSQELLPSRAKWGSPPPPGGFPIIQRLLVFITELCQSSCVLDGSTSLWSNGSASVLHLLAGLSWAVAVSLWSSKGSREPFWSWLGALGGLQASSDRGAGASPSGREGPLDWTDSAFTWFIGGNGAPSTGWLEVWLTIPGNDKLKVS